MILCHHYIGCREKGIKGLSGGERGDQKDKEEWGHGGILLGYFGKK